MSVSQASMITAEAITIQNVKNSINHCVLRSVLIVVLELELFFSDSQALPMLILSAIHHFVRITLFIRSIYIPRLEAQLN